jgi:DNA-directed RNA polymerase specialized sigma24 family protein
LKLLGHSKLAAQELTKRVFINAFKQISTYPENETFILWLRTIAVYEIKKGDIEKLIEVHEAGAVEEAIFSLPIEERIIFIFHDIDKLQNEEITLITNETVENITLKLSSARKLMMDKLSVRRLDDLDYKVAFLPKNVEPGNDLWNIIFKEINKVGSEELKNKESMEEKFKGFFKKRN